VPRILSSLSRKRAQDATTFRAFAKDRTSSSYAVRSPATEQEKETDRRGTFKTFNTFNSPTKQARHGGTTSGNLILRLRDRRRCVSSVSGSARRWIPRRDRNLPKLLPNEAKYNEDLHAVEISRSRPNLDDEQNVVVIFLDNCCQPDFFQLSIIFRRLHPESEYVAPGGRQPLWLAREPESVPLPIVFFACMTASFEGRIVGIMLQFLAYPTLALEAQQRVEQRRPRGAVEARRRADAPRRPKVERVVAEREDGR